MASAQPDTDPLVGTTLGSYRIRGLVHVGEGSTLYAAEQEELGRQAVVKVVAPGRAQDEEAVERFLREARTIASLRHANVVLIYDLGRLDDGRPYSVMERLEGQTLADVLESDEDLPLSRIGEIVDAIAAALSALHEKGIVHRNLKPENVLLAAAGGSDTIKLIDFGLVATPTPAGGRRLTRVGEALGTPHYMAPEALGETPLDSRADVYALATVAFEMLSGETPFDHDDPLELLAIKSAREPPTLRDGLGTEVPDVLERAIARGLARDRDARTPTARELASEIRAGLDAWASPPARPSVHRSARPPAPATPAAEDEPGVATPAADDDPAHVPMQSRTPVAVVVAAVGLLAGAGIAWLAYPAEEEPTTAATSSASPTQTGSEAAADTPATGGEDTAQGPASTAPDEASMPRGRDVPPPSRGARRGRRASTPAANATAAQSGDPATPVPTLPEGDRRAAVEATGRGTSALVRGRLPDAIRHFRDATLSNPHHAAAWRGLGLANERLGRLPEAIEAYDQYLALAPSARDADVVRERLATLRR